MNYAIILSGGIGSRMNSESLPKQYIEVNDKPVLMYTLKAFNQSEEIDHIVIVANPEWHEQISKWLKTFGITKAVTLACNGEHRQASVISGLRACAQVKAPDETDKVIIHDAVRPFIDQRIIRDCMAALDSHISCLTAVPDYDTTYITLDKETIHDYIDRDKLTLGQTPEGFVLKQYLKMCEEADPEELKNLHGACELAFSRGHTIKLVMGSTLNFKLTRADDLILFKALAAGDLN